MKSTREKILKTLLAFPGSSINDLAEAVGINGISIRHHLSALEAENLVSSAEERHGVGRPRLIYSLTEKGVEQFPTRYLRLSQHLLSALKEKLPVDQIEKLFHKIGEDIVETYQFDANHQKPEKRLEAIKQILTKEGFIVEWEKEGDAYQITALSCPYFHIGMDHPEICGLDRAIISAFFKSEISVGSCILNGDDRCTYKIQYPPGKDVSHE